MGELSPTCLSVKVPCPLVQRKGVEAVVAESSYLLLLSDVFISAASYISSKFLH